MRVVKGTIFVALVLILATWLYFCTPAWFYGTGVDTLHLHLYGLVMVGGVGKVPEGETNIDGWSARVVWGDINVGVYGQWVVTTLPIVPVWIRW